MRAAVYWLWRAWPQGLRAIRDQPSRAHAVVAGRVPAKSRDPRRDFCPKPRPGEKTRTTHRPTSYEPLLPNFVSDRRRPRGERCPTLRWPDRLETAPKKTIVGHFAWFLAVFSARRAAFAAAFFAMRRPTAGAQPGLPLGAWHSSANLSESLALECQPVSPSASKTASVNSLVAILIVRLLSSSHLLSHTTQPPTRKGGPEHRRGSPAGESRRWRRRV